MTMQTTADETHPAKRVHVVGKKNSGKTTLVCDLVKLLTKRGLSVATIKHTHHNHELDTSGKDSWRHRQAGATAIGILAAEMTAVFLPVTRSADESQRYAQLESVLAGCDLILVEGDLHCDAPKLEVWRQATSSAPYAATIAGINVVVTDDRIPDDPDADFTPSNSDSAKNEVKHETAKSQAVTIPRSNLQQIAEAVLQLASGAQCTDG